MKNIDIKQLQTLLQKGFKYVQGYSSFIFIISILLIYSFLVFQIGSLSRSEPSEEAVAEKANTVKRLKLDQGAIDKIQQLEDQDVRVQSLFESARDNPFQD